jgi:hypothetical protein
MVQPCLKNAHHKKGLAELLLIENKFFKTTTMRQAYCLDLDF